MTARYRTAILGTALALALASPTYTQSANKSPANPQPPASGTTGQDKQTASMSMDDTMKQCREHCNATQKQIAAMTKNMDEARQSNDPAKMRAALQDAQKPMLEMKTHMDQCMRMMDMVQNMSGMMKKK